LDLFRANPLGKWLIAKDFIIGRIIMAQAITPLYAEARILLKLWDLAQAEVSKSNFMPGNAPAYQKALAQLEAEAALSSKAKTSRSKVYSLTDQGKARLALVMANPEFLFTANVGAKTANSVLNWFRLNGQAVATPSAAAPAAVITTYPEFLAETLRIYDELNRDYNLGDLVPIYRIRRAMGDRLSRSQFTEWLLEMQANDLVQLMGEQVPSVTRDQLEDSITIPGGGLRFYVKRL